MHPEEDNQVKFNVYDKNFKAISVLQDEIYCYGCGAIFKFHPETRLQTSRYEEQDCPGKPSNKSCHYKFYAFLTKEEAEKFYQEQVSTDEKYIFLQEATGKWFVSFVYNETIRYSPKILTDFVPLENLKLCAYGITEASDTVVNILFPTTYNDADSALKSLLIDFKSEMTSKYEDYQHSKCKRFHQFCALMRYLEYKHAESLGPNTKNINGICLKEGGHWIFPIWIQNKLYGAILGGSYRCAEHTDIEEIINVLQNDNVFKVHREYSIRRMDSFLETLCKKIIELKEYYKDNTEKLNNLNEIDAIFNSYQNEDRKTRFINQNAVMSYIFSLRIDELTKTSDCIKNIKFDFGKKNNLSLYDILVKYDDVKKNVSTIIKTTHSCFAQKRHEQENEFRHEIISRFEKKHEILVDVGWCWEKIREILQRIKEFLGLDLVLVFSNEEDDNTFKLRRDANPPLLLHPIEKDYDINKFLTDSREVFFTEDMIDDRKYSGNPINLKNVFEKTIKGYNNKLEVIAILPISMSIRIGEKKWDLLVFYSEKNKTFENKKEIYKTIRSTLTSMFRFIQSENTRNDYLAKVNHEFLRPVAAIKSCIDYLDAKIKWKDIEEYNPNSFRLLKNNLESINSFVMVFNLIAKNIFYAKGYDFGQPIYSLFNVLEEVVWPTIRLYGKEIAFKKIQIEYGNIKDTPRVISSKSHIFQVFNNIFFNSVKYSYSDTAISLSQDVRGGLLYIYVTNLGIGIPRGEDSLIFRRGFRGSNVGSKDIRGTGEGLAVSKKIIEELEGDIGFHRGKINNEITFFFGFPYKRS